MFDLIQSGGSLMVPILLCSILAMAIILERFWTLRAEQIAPPNAVPEVLALVRNRQLNQQRLRALKSSSPLGRILAAGLINAKHGRVVMKESIEEAASSVVHELERFLNSLGTIATITPLLGLLGTVIGMIKVFSVIQMQGAGDASALAGGISEALITTASGLAVAIPAVIFHRYFTRRVDEIVIFMEQEAIKLIEVIMGDREVEKKETDFDEVSTSPR